MFYRLPYIISIVLIGILSWQDMTILAQNIPNVNGFRPPRGTSIVGIADSSFVDSLDLPEIDIKPDLKFADREQIFEHKPELFRVKRNIRNVLTWDAIDFAEGFVAQLGQIGKPHLVLRDGIAEQFQRRDIWQNPFYSNYNRYIFDAVYAPVYYDTKTPYISIDFMQGPQGVKRLNTATVTLSQNITPNWNAAFFYNRRRAFGTFPSNETDLESAYLSTYIRSKNRRYHAFSTYAFSENLNEFNGGIFIGADSLFQTQNGLFIQNDSLVALTFAGTKEEIRTLLNDFQANRILRSIYSDQYYHFIGHPDSNSTNIITLRGTALYENLYQRFRDNSLTSTDEQFIDINPVPVLPTWNRDSNSIADAFNTNTFMLRGELSYSINGPIRLHANGGIGFRRIDMIRSDSMELNQNSIEPRLHGEIQIPRLTAELDFDQRISDLFNVQTRLSVRGRFEPFSKKPLYPSTFPDDLVTLDSLSTQTDSLIQKVDSLSENSQDRKRLPPPSPRRKKTPTLAVIEERYPLLLEFEYDQFDLNPSVFQTNFAPPPSNTFIPNSDIDNQNITRFAAQLTYQPAGRIRKGDTLLPNFSKVRVFASRVGQPVFYTDNLEVQQGGDGENYTWVGAELSARQHLFWWLYAQGKVAWQRGSSSAGQEEPLTRYAENIPELYGKLSVYFDNRTLSIAKVMHIGLDAYANTPFTGFTVDPISQEFFPTRYQVSTSLRVDAYFGLKLGPAYAYMKVINIAESIPDPVFFTSPLHPMQERTITLGLNWVFFD